MKSCLFYFLSTYCREIDVPARFINKYTWNFFFFSMITQYIFCVRCNKNNNFIFHKRPADGNSITSLHKLPYARRRHVTSSTKKINKSADGVFTQNV